MKDFYRITEPYTGKETKEVYQQNKRKTVLETIKPICEVFGITNYDYLIDHSKGVERLVVEGQAIGCMCNSIGATVMELIGYIFANTWLENRCSRYDKQIAEVIKNCWMEEK